VLTNPARYLVHYLNDPDRLEQERDWQTFREGVDISIIYQEPDNGPSAAFLRYQPGASVPPHEHMGYEHIFILAGEQSDERGNYPQGTLLIHQPATSHQVSSAKGCIALAIWQAPVRFG
jgi:anti-sigma factor ChrR (cupin superfamily)